MEMMFENFLIREITKEDNKGIQRVIRSCLEEYGAATDGTAWSDPDLGRFSEIYIGDGQKYWVAVDEKNNVVGGVGIGRINNEECICELQKMYIIPKLRGTGLAYELMKLALLYAKKFYKGVYLETLPNMQRAMKFYEKHGFERVDNPLFETKHFLCDVRYLKKL